MIKRKIIDHKMIAPTDGRLEVIGAFNPAAVRFGDETVLIIRVAEKAVQTEKDAFIVPIAGDNGLELIKLSLNAGYDFSDPRVVKGKNEFYLTSLSHFIVVRSKNGFDFDPDSALCVMPEGEYERYGIEDPRITFIDGAYYITYTAVSAHGIHVALMKTTDFIEFERLGNVLPADNKDCVIFPEKVGGSYYAMHRPSLEQYGRLDIWTAKSDNLICWGDHKVMTDARVDFIDSERLGAGAPPIATEDGFLEIYHSADHSGKYELIAMLLDKDDPMKVLKKSKKALLNATDDFEKEGFMKNAVFTCGAIVSGDTLDIYYGVCDENVAVARLSLGEVRDNMEEA